MLKVISSLLIYLLSFGMWGFITYMICKVNLHKKSKLILAGLIMIWSGLIFNVIYTGILGWNFLPASDLESFLDSITFVTQMLGMIICYIGYYKLIKK